MAKQLPKIKGAPGVHMLSDNAVDFRKLENAAWATLMKEPTLKNLADWNLIRTMTTAYVIQDIAGTKQPAKKRAKPAKGSKRGP